MTRAPAATSGEADPRVVLRRSGSDWQDVTFRSLADVEFAASLMEVAVAAHRPPSGVTAQPPPAGSRPRATASIPLMTIDHGRLLAELLAPGALVLVDGVGTFSIEDLLPRPFRLT